jgi:hypothetical protein
MSVGWGLATRGVLARFELRPPPFMPFVGVSLIAAAALGLSPLGRMLATELPLAALVGAQAFRLPLELVMHRAANEGVMPQQMTYTGWNYDIATGIAALLIAGLLVLGAAPRWLVWAWNLIGAALLATIITIAVASLPLFHAFGTAPERLNTWVAYPPFVWLPSVLVPAALLGHILVTRRLLGSRR